MTPLGGKPEVISPLAAVFIVCEVPVMDGAAMSVAVMVWLPTVLSVTEKLALPTGSIESSGSTALVSVLVRCTVPE
jgi:hypothetical protein